MVRRLRKKFNGDKDYWCYVASLTYQQETAPLRRALTQTVGALNQLGVPIDERAASVSTGTARGSAFGPAPLVLVSLSDCHSLGLP